MNKRLLQLQQLNTLLSEYGESLAEKSVNLPASPDSAATKKALLQIHRLQLDVVASIDTIVRSDAPFSGRHLDSPENADVLVRDLRAAVGRSRLKRNANIPERLVNPALTEDFERLYYTILGPNHFPDDEGDSLAQQPARK